MVVRLLFVIAIIFIFTGYSVSAQSVNALGKSGYHTVDKSSSLSHLRTQVPQRSLRPSYVVKNAKPWNAVTSQKIVVKEDNIDDKIDAERGNTKGLKVILPIALLILFL